MKKMKSVLAVALVAMLAGGALSLQAEEHKHDKKEHKEHEAEGKADKKAKAYPLDTCVVSDEKLGEHGKPFVFIHEGQEIKMCCKDCLKDFKKEPAKYLKKIEDAKVKAKK